MPESNGGCPRPSVLSAELVERWGPIGHSHRRLTHRRSYEQLVWVSPASVRRVLVEHC
jgi:hypothetical protein